MTSTQLIEMKKMLKSAADQIPPLSPNSNFVKLRSDGENLASTLFPTKESGVTFTTDNIKDIGIEICTPENSSGDSIVFHIHGGAFATGSARMSRNFLSIIAIETGLKVYSIDYRLAPEYPYPAAPNDCFTVYEALVEKYQGRKISIIGESAGGTLALVTTLKAMQKGISIPTSVTVWSPLTDATGSIDRRKYTDTELSLPSDIDNLIREIYIPENEDLRNPYISPIYGGYKGFPPLKIVVDSGEMLFEDSVLLAEKAKSSGVKVEYQIWDDTFHVFPIMGRLLPEAVQVLKETSEFIKFNSK